MVFRRRADDGTNYEDIKLGQPVYVAILFLSIFHGFLRIVDKLNLLNVNFFHRSLFTAVIEILADRNVIEGPKCHWKHEMSLESRNIMEATRRDCTLLTDDFSGLPLELLSRLCGACVGRINVQSVDFKKNFLLLLFISDVVAVFRFF